MFQLFLTDVAVLSSESQILDLCPIALVDTQCHLTLEKASDLETKLCEWDKSQPHVVEYTIHFDQWDPWDIAKWADETTSNVFKPRNYKHVFTKHGRTLLALPFNYKTFSMQAFSSGVDELELRIKDSPKYCFHNLSTTNKLALTNELFFTTFLNDTWRSKNAIHRNEDANTCTEKGEQICRHTLGSRWPGFECCWLNTSSTNCSNIDCDHKLNMFENDLAIWLFITVNWSYFYFLLFGPALLMRLNRGKISFV